MLKEILRKYRASYLGATIFSIGATIFITLFSLQLGVVVDSAQKAHSNLLGQFFICLFCTCAWSLCSLLAIWFKNNHNKQRGFSVLFMTRICMTRLPSRKIAISTQRPRIWIFTKRIT